MAHNIKSTHTYVGECEIAGDTFTTGVDAQWVIPGYGASVNIMLTNMVDVELINMMLAEAYRQGHVDGYAECGDKIISKIQKFNTTPGAKR